MISVDAALVRSRIVVYLLFVIFGTVVATWAVHIPSVQQRTGVSAAVLGTFLLVLGVGALLGMQLGGVLITRFGAGKTAVAGGITMPVTLAGPLLSTTPWTLAVTLVVFGTAMGILDVAMNARAVVVERAYGRPIMSSFHAVFSVGSVIGSVAGAFMLSRGLGMIATSMIVAMVLLLVLAWTLPDLLSNRDDTDHPTEAALPNEATPPPRSTRPPRRRIIVLGLLAFLLYLCEGSAMDWSSLHAQQHLGASPALGALALASFVCAMTIGRLLADSATARWGPVTVVRAGCATAAIGLLLVVISPTLPLTMTGWVVSGLGLSGCVPAVISAAGNLAGATGTDFSRVVGLGYLALLAGPAVIGWVSDLLSLHGAMVIPLVAVVFSGFGAEQVRRERPITQRETVQP